MTKDQNQTADKEIAKQLSISFCWRKTIEYAQLYAGGIYIGSTECWTRHPSRGETQWRAWIMTNDEGSNVGWYTTEDEAKTALMHAAYRLLQQKETDHAP